MSQPTDPPRPTSRGSIGLLAAISIGVGGMIGAGIYSILGVVTQVSGSALTVSFVGARPVPHRGERERGC